MMSAETIAPKSPTALVWIGRVISLLPVLGLTMSAYFKFQGGKELAEGLEKSGWPVHLAFTLGIVELACTVLYLIPQTAVLGAILLTGYLGGATATHVRIEDPIWFPPVIFGVLIWLGLLLRERRLWPLLPFRKL